MTIFLPVGNIKYKIKFFSLSFKTITGLTKETQTKYLMNVN